MTTPTTAPPKKAASTEKRKKDRESLSTNQAHNTSNDNNIVVDDADRVDNVVVNLDTEKSDDGIGTVVEKSTSRAEWPPGLFTMVLE